MTIHEFSKRVAKNEALKEQVNIAQIKEILKVINGLIPCGIFYAIVKRIK